jgi:hypothetical protein
VFPEFPNFPKNCPFLNLIANAHRDGILLQMRIEGEVSAADIHNNVIAVDGIDGDGVWVR